MADGKGRGDDRIIQRIHLLIPLSIIPLTSSGARAVSLRTIHGPGDEAGRGAGTANEKKDQHHGYRHQRNGYDHQREVVRGRRRRHCRRQGQWRGLRRRRGRRGRRLRIADCGLWIGGRDGRRRGRRRGGRRRGFGGNGGGSRLVGSHTRCVDSRGPTPVPPIPPIPLIPPVHRLDRRGWRFTGAGEGGGLNGRLWFRRRALWRRGRCRDRRRVGLRGWAGSENNVNVARLGRLGRNDGRGRRIGRGDGRNGIGFGRLEQIRRQRQRGGGRGSDPVIEDFARRAPPGR